MAATALLAAALTSCAQPAAHTARPAADRAPAAVRQPPAPASAAWDSGEANRPRPYADQTATAAPSFPPPTAVRRPARAPRKPTSAASGPTSAPPPKTTLPRATAPPAVKAPRPAPTPARSSKSATAKRSAARPQYPPGTTVLRIGDWSRPVVRGDQATIDTCKAAVLFAGPDPALADGYDMSTSVIVGHDFCGYDKLAPLPIGTQVTLDTPKGTLSFHVYATYINPGQGGPDNGLYWGDLTLQTCVGADTGFSYLTRDRT
ncbi:hypothetical protein [Streptomyces sp. CA-111067]|uniref:hypothetical protein n=1 Tax=Streptomyces sp. CA-111067 TaxID=3240046 RepID=UPI003D98B17C